MSEESRYDAAVRQSRITRLSSELHDEGVRIFDATDPKMGLLLEEIVYARYIEVHEGIWPPYGSVIAARDVCVKLPGSLLDSDASQEAVRPFANGLDSFLIRAVEQPNVTTIWASAPVDELELVRIARKDDATIIQRTAEGVIKLITRDIIWLNTGFHWRSRPTARSRILALDRQLDLGEAGRLELVAKLLDFVVHRLSPRGIGTTLVLDVVGDATFQDTSFQDVGHETPLSLDMSDETNTRMMISFLNIVDGACLIDSKGSLIRTEVKLHSSERAMEITEAERGTRHTSAKRFSYDHPNVIVFVVSADGPVTLYSDGVASAVLKNNLTNQFLSSIDLVIQQVEDRSEASEIVLCTRCDRSIRIESVSLPATDRDRQIDCPICEEALVRMCVTSVRVQTQKPWSAS